MTAKNRDKNKKRRPYLRKYISPAFLVVLIISFTMWYLTKLSHDYTAEIPVKVEVEGNRFKVVCVAHGSGYRILSHRVFPKSDVSVKFNDLNTVPSTERPGYYVISPASLQQAISLSNNDLTIIAVRDIPEIRPKAQ